MVVRVVVGVPSISRFPRAARNLGPICLIPHVLVEETESEKKRDKLLVPEEVA